MWTAVEELAATTGRQEACAALGVSRASYYRQLRPRSRTVRRAASPAWALSAEEVAYVLELLHSEGASHKCGVEC